MGDVHHLDRRRETARTGNRVSTSCLCNHNAAAHGLPDDATGKIVAPCLKCRCTVFEEDPIYAPDVADAPPEYLHEENAQ